MAWTQRASFTAGLFALANVLAVGCANGDEDTCDPECPAFYMCCAGGDDVSCRDVVNDPTNCGGCGVTCPSGVCREARCVPGPAPTDGGTPGTIDSGGGGGSCSPSCSSDERCCGSTCSARTGVTVGTDGRSDPSFDACNGCGIECDDTRASACSVPGGGAMGTPRCMCGSLDQCRVGELCVAQAGSFTCVSTNTDPMNCGGLGTRCAAGESCVGGMCQCGSTGAACTPGQQCCGGACVDVNSDGMNCGMCGVVCAMGESCQAGACVCGSGPTARACTPPMAGTLGVSGSPGESCCDGMCVANTDMNCGCGVTCSGTDTCRVGGNLLGMGGGTAQVCCGGQTVEFLGCGGFGGGGDGGLPFPIP